MGAAAPDGWIWLSIVCIKAQCQMKVCMDRFREAFLGLAPPSCSLPADILKQKTTAVADEVRRSKVCADLSAVSLFGCTEALTQTHH